MRELRSLLISLEELIRASAEWALGANPAGVGGESRKKAVSCAKAVCGISLCRGSMRASDFV